MRLVVVGRLVMVVGVVTVRVEFFIGTGSFRRW
jgi:hypothetical protein